MQLQISFPSAWFRQDKTESPSTLPQWQRQREETRSSTDPKNTKLDTPRLTPHRMEESWSHLLDRRTCGIEAAAEGCFLGVVGCSYLCSQKLEWLLLDFDFVLLLTFKKDDEPRSMSCIHNAIVGFSLYVANNSVRWVSSSGFVHPSASGCILICIILDQDQPHW